MITRRPTWNVYRPWSFRNAIGLLLGLALAMLVVGIFAPIMTLKQFLLFKNQVSIYTGLVRLFHDGQYFLFVVIFVFSICFPTAKILLLAYVWHGKALSANRRLQLIRRLDTLGKWSMLDVFIVALFVVIIKLDIIADVEVHAGIYIFSASILLSMLASLLMRCAHPDHQAGIPR